MIDGNFGSNLQTDGSSPVTTNNVSQYFPTAKIGNSIYFIAFSDSMRNYIGLAGLTGIAQGNLANWQVQPPTGTIGMTPIDAYSIDVKLDDGMPNTGYVRAITPDLVVSGLGTAADFMQPAEIGEGICITGGGTTNSPYDMSDVYNINPSNGGTQPACDMEFRL